MTGDRGRGWRRHVPNEEVSYHERSVQDVMIEDLQRQVAELTKHLAAQIMEMNCDIDGRNSESNFENPYYNPVLFREQRDRNKRHGDLGFWVELSEFSGTLTALTIVSKSQAHLPNPSYVEDKFIEEDFSIDWVSPPIYDIYPNKEDLLQEVSFVVDVIKFIEKIRLLCVGSPHNEGFQLSNEEFHYVDWKFSIEFS